MSIGLIQPCFQSQHWILAHNLYNDVYVTYSIMYDETRVFNVLIYLICMSGIALIMKSVLFSVHTLIQGFIFPTASVSSSGSSRTTYLYAAVTHHAEWIICHYHRKLFCGAFPVEWPNRYLGNTASSIAQPLAFWTLANSNLWLISLWCSLQRRCSDQMMWNAADKIISPRSVE